MFAQAAQKCRPERPILRRPHVDAEHLAFAFAGDANGDERYLGTEVDLGFQWRFAPGLALDVVGAYTFAGDALNAQYGPDPGLTNPPRFRKFHGESGDIQSVTARVRYTF